MFLSKGRAFWCIRPVIALFALDLCAQQNPVPAVTPSNAGVSHNWGLPTDGFQISVHFVEAEASAESVQAVVTTRNISDRELSYVANISHYVEFVIVDAAGKRVPARSELQTKTPFQMRSEKTIRNPRYITIAPNEQREDTFDLAKLFDLPRGRFTVSVSRTVPTGNDPRVTVQAVSGNATLVVGDSAASGGPRGEEKPATEANPDSFEGETAVAVRRTSVPSEASAPSRLGHNTQVEISSAAKPAFAASAQPAWYRRKAVYGIALGLAAVLGVCVFAYRRIRGKQSDV